MKIQKIAILGLGLMGASLAQACRKAFPRSKIIGISRDSSVLRLALRKKWIHESFQDPKLGVGSADLIILCTPIQTFSDYLRIINRFGKPGVLVTDVGSLKVPVEKFLKKADFSRLSFVGSHPMVGSHERGMKAAREDLYRYGLVFVTQSKKTPSKSMQVIQGFWKQLEMKVMEIRAEEHDRIMSEISHLPHALAVCLVLASSQKNLCFSGPGFRDTTRIAQGHPSIWTPILMGNKKNLLRDLGAFETQIKKFKKIMIKDDQRKLAVILDHARRKRAQISL